MICTVSCGWEVEEPGFTSVLFTSAVLKKPVRGGEGSCKLRPGVICRHRLSASHFAELGL